MLQRILSDCRLYIIFNSFFLVLHTQYFNALYFFIKFLKEDKEFPTVTSEIEFSIHYSIFMKNITIWESTFFNDSTFSF